MTIMRMISSGIVCGVLAVGCMSSATEDSTVGEAAQELGATTQAQEREITYFSDATHQTEVGWCIGPYMCFGPKGLHCSGIKTLYSEVTWTDCGEP